MYIIFLFVILMSNVHCCETKSIEMVEIKKTSLNINKSNDNISDLTDSSLASFLSYDFSDFDSYFDSLYHNNFVAYAKMHSPHKINDDISIFSKASTECILCYPYNKK